MSPVRSILLALPLLLGACAIDPFDRPGTWKPEGVNDSNLRAMVADPHDLTRGVDEPAMPAQTAAMAVQRLRADKVKLLPDTAVAKIGPSGATGGTN
jgi:hypothetical protein